MAAEARDATTRKIRILCFHGFRQDAELFRSKMGALRKQLKSKVTFVFVDAPHPVTEKTCMNDVSGEVITWKGEKPWESDEDEKAQIAERKRQEKKFFKQFYTNDSDDDDIKKENKRKKPCTEGYKGRSWWFTDDKGMFDPKSRNKTAEGFDKSLDVVNEAFRTNGPFDGILGFSQGGAFAAIICGLKENEKFDYDFKFAIIISGFKSMLLDHHSHYFYSINIPSLHIIGKADECISKDLSNALMNVFRKKTVIYHEGGHYVPVNSSFKLQYLSFFKEVMNM